MEKPTDFHSVVMLFKTFRKEHQMVIMAPDDITLPVVLIYNISKHLVCYLVGSKLRLEATCCGKSIFLWEPKIVEKRP